MIRRPPPGLQTKPIDWTQYDSFGEESSLPVNKIVEGEDCSKIREKVMQSIKATWSTIINHSAQANYYEL